MGLLMRADYVTKCTFARQWGICRELQASHTLASREQICDVDIRTSRAFRIRRKKVAYNPLNLGKFESPSGEKRKQSSPLHMLVEISH
jgi:hypothetical protein